MLDALLSVCLGALFAAGLALRSGTLADALEAGAVALLIGIVGAGMLDDLRGRVVVGGPGSGEEEAHTGDNVCERHKPARA